eukprot:6214071-Pleurochrysis_carterae.AAC.2
MPIALEPICIASFTEAIKSSKQSRGKGIFTSIILRRVRLVGGRTVLRNTARKGSRNQHFGILVVGPGPTGTRGDLPR